MTGRLPYTAVNYSTYDMFCVAQIWMSRVLVQERMDGWLDRETDSHTPIAPCNNDANGSWGVVQRGSLINKINILQ